MFRKLGDVHCDETRLDEAQASFKRAGELHRQAQSVLVSKRCQEPWRGAFADETS